MWYFSALVYEKTHSRITFFLQQKEEKKDNVLDNEMKKKRINTLIFINYWYKFIHGETIKFFKILY